MSTTRIQRIAPSAGDNPNITPTPWYNVSGSVCTTPDDNETGARIAIMDYNEPKTRPTERSANCQYIVTACNAYPDLIRFTELVRDFFTNDSAGHAIYLKEQAENCLARCKGE